MSDEVNPDRRRLRSAIMAIATAEPALVKSAHPSAVTASARQVASYFAWRRPDEAAAPLGILEDRFAAPFELRRLR